MRGSALSKVDLGWSKTSFCQSAGGDINPLPNKPWFLRVCCTSPLKTSREKEKWLFMSQFSFSHSVFKRLVSQGRQKESLCGNGLNDKCCRPRT